jgi:hypothetical protein
MKMNSIIKFILSCMMAYAITMLIYVTYTLCTIAETGTDYLNLSIVGIALIPIVFLGLYFIIHINTKKS